MRKLTNHIINNNGLHIATTDDLGPGDAYHRYEITGYDAGTNPSYHSCDDCEKLKYNTTILFQNGTILENGHNGVTIEDLLAIIIDRLECFQDGKFACEENAMALIKAKEALHWQQQRTITRMNRGVEGKHQV